MAEDASIRPPLVRALNLLRKPAALVFAVLLLLLIPYLLKYLSRKPPPLPPPPAERTLGLQEFINDLKTEMANLEAERVKKNESAVFDISGFDLEISFVVRTSSQQKAAVEYQIVTAESQIQQGMERVQKLTLHMKPTGINPVPTKKTEFPSKGDVGPETVVDQPPHKKGVTQ